MGKTAIRPVLYDRSILLLNREEEAKLTRGIFVILLIVIVFFFHFYFTCKVNFLLSLRACNVYMFLNFVCFCCWAWVLTVHGTVLWLKF